MSANGGCEHDCNNTIGSFECLCYIGFSLDMNGMNCTGMLPLKMLTTSLLCQFTVVLYETSAIFVIFRC